MGAQHPAQAGQQPGGLILLIQPLAPGRVGGQQPLIGKIPGAQRAQLAALEVNRLAHTGALGIVHGQFQRLGIRVKPLHGRQIPQLAQAGGGLFHGRFPQRPAATAPGHEAVLAAQCTGRHTRRHPGALDQQGAAAAERVHQQPRTVGTMPATGPQHRRRQIFTQRRAPTGQTVATAMQRGAGQVQPQPGALPVDAGAQRQRPFFPARHAHCGRESVQHMPGTDAAVAAHPFAMI